MGKVVAAVGIPLAKLLGVGALVWAFANEIIAFLGSLFLNLAAYILGLSGNIFNWLIDRTVVDFAGTLKVLGMMDGINTVWTAFRDISNIVIIGMFTFIAICIILGIKEYGQKKLIASVLMIAVLLNFSLLFTKMIIDASNFTALQFYNSASLPPATASAAVSPTESSSADGISGRFLNIVGITGVFDTYNQLSDSAKLNGSWSTFGYALTGTLLLLMVAGVFLYGSFLLAARAALLIFIMIISPLAFASHLVPWVGDVSFAWKGWWKNLIRCALFGPLLMIFLWASLLILSKATPGNVSFGDFLTNPANPNAWQLVVMYCFTIAFLFISIRFANSFASSIGGFSLAQMVTAGPLAFAGNFAWNRGRNLAQRGAGIWRESMQTDVNAAKSRAARAGSRVKELVDKGQFHMLTPSAQRELTSQAQKTQAEANKLGRRSDRLEEFGKSKLSPFGTELGKKTMKALGVPGFLTGQAESFGTQAEKTAKEAAARAEKAMLLTDKDRERLRGESETEARKRHSEERRVAEQQLGATKEGLQTIRESAAHKEHTANEDVAKNRRDALKVAHDAEIDRMAKGGSSADDIEKKMAEHKAELRTEEHKIATAQTAIAKLEGSHADELKKLQKMVEDYKDRGKSDNRIKELSGEILKEWTRGSTEVAAAMAEQTAHRRSTNIVSRVLREDPKNDYTSRLARGLVEKNVREKNQGGDILKAIKAMTDATGGSTPPPAAPATGGHT